PEIVFRAPSRQLCGEAALVLEAAGLRPVVHDHEGHWIVAVAAHEAKPARHEIDAWRAEQQAVRPEPPARRPLANGRAGILGYLLVVVAVALAVGNYALGLDWLAAGRIDGAAMRAGEWWRAFTGLTL